MPVAGSTLAVSVSVDRQRNTGNGGSPAHGVIDAVTRNVPPTCSMEVAGDTDALGGWLQSGVGIITLFGSAVQAAIPTTMLANRISFMATDTSSSLTESDSCKASRLS